MIDFMVAALVCIGIIGLGEVVSYFTKALFPSMAAALFIYLILTWIGMPKTFPETAGFTLLGQFSMLLLVAHLGTSIPPGDYIKNKKSVIVAIASVIGGLICTVGIGGIFFGFDVMLGGAGAACGGGAIAGIMAIQKLTDLGLAHLIAVPAIIIGTVDLVGQPIASFVLKKYAKQLRTSDSYLLDKEANRTESVRLTKDGVPFGSEDNPSSRITALIPKNLESDGFVLFELTLIAAAAVFLEHITGFNSCIYAFVIGAAGCALGVFRMNLLDRSHSYGFIITVFIAWIFDSMNEITPQSLLAAIGPAIALLVLSAIGLGLGAGIAGKLLGYDFKLSAAAGIGLMFLMPGVMIVCTEVAARSARNKEEEKYMYNDMAPSLYIVANVGYIIGVGFTVSCLLPLLVHF